MGGDESKITVGSCIYSAPTQDLSRERALWASRKRGLELGPSALIALVPSRARNCICGLPGSLDQAASFSVLGHHLLPDAPHAWT